MGSLKVSLKEAQEIFKKAVPVPQKEEKKVEECAGQILAEPVYAKVTQPPFPRSAMDGYALRSQDTRGADERHPAVLTVTGCIYAGQNAKEIIKSPVKSREAVRIMTGAMIPEGADCVVKQEDTKPSVDGKIQILHEGARWENYCREGEDFLKGEMLAEKGMPVDAYLMAAAVAAGVSSFSVYRRLRVAVITTGDELQTTDLPLKAGKIYDANGIWLAGRLKELGCEPAGYCIAGDDSGRIREEIEKALGTADLVLTTGGVSVGEKDLLPAVLRRMQGKVLFRGVRIKPGMPTMLSVVNGTPVLSLSGNPFAVTAVFEMLAGHLLSEMPQSGYRQKKVLSVLKQDFKKTGKAERIVKGRLDETGVLLPQIQKNGQLKNGIGSNCLVVFPEGERTYAAGEKLPVIGI